MSMLDAMKRSLTAIQRDLAENLKEGRASARLSQEALALEAEVDRTYVSQIERGVGNPSIAVLVRLANCLRMDLSDLLRRR
jgi:transcriptional regulator with XRE-family HTH domain